MRRVWLEACDSLIPALIIMTDIPPLQAGNAYRRAAARMPHFLYVTSAGLAMNQHWLIHRKARRFAA